MRFCKNSKFLLKYHTEDVTDGGLESGGLESGGLESRATDFGSGSVHSGCVLSLGVYSLGPRVWGSRGSGNRFRIWNCTHQAGGLESGGLESGGLEARATDFGSGSVLPLRSGEPEADGTLGV